MSAAPSGWGIGTTRRYSLYRFFNADGTLMYVGVTGVPRARWSRHSEIKSWWPEVSRASIEHYANREDLVEAEAAAILTESPLYNVALPRHRRPASGAP